MKDEYVSTLAASVDDARTFDGLTVAQSEEGYVFETPTVRREGLSREELAAVAADNERFVTNWYFWHERAPSKDDHWAFLRWLERADETSVPDRYDVLADGMTRTWGQLAITTTLGEDGQRRYAARHVDDRDADADELESHDDPLAARRLVKRDDDGRYRPLKTAPSLPTGWQFPDLEPAAVVQLVEFVYPATVANWHRERNDDLDVTHWRETAERQTGIYDVVDELDDDAVAWMTEACCVDDECLKRREWDLDGETPLDVPRGDGEFPCREPCSLVIAAARTWTKLEREESRTYEVELTPSEKAQLEALIDAVADGRAGDVREADLEDPVNRRRVRYLRAKLFDDDGTL